MRVKTKRALVITSLMAVVVIGSSSGALAQEPFLCPVVGAGVLNADSHNGDNGVATITPAVGTSLLPGQNRAGENADPQAYNTLGPGNPEAGPGGNPDFSPIWPG